MGEVLGKLKGRIVKQVDYDTVRGALIVKHNAHPTQTAERVAAKLKERGVAKVHAASEFAEADPPDEVADALGDLANGRAKNINEAGPLPIEGALTGPQKTVGGPQDFSNSAYRSATRENEAAQALKDAGYKVEQIPEADGSLDYRINGHGYDCSSPFYDPANPGRTQLTQEAAIASMWDNLKTQKIDRGHTRIVLNLDDFGAPKDDVLQYFRDNPISNADDIFVLKNNQLVPFWDFLR